MSTLSNVVAAILRDLTAAQAAGTRKSLQLRACELELRFAVTGAVAADGDRSSFDPPRAFFEQASAHIAAAAVEEAAAHLQECLDLADDRERWERIAGHIAGDDFRRFVTEHLATALHRHRDDAAQTVHEALALHLFDNPALERVFAPHSRGRQRVLQRLAPVIDARLGELAQELASAPAPPALPQLEILVTANELAGMESALVSTIRLHIDAGDASAAGEVA